MIFFFFFSSRRRHTRSLCDWSSDVCSSDLLRGALTAVHAAIEAGLDVRGYYVWRSEERRVGKSVDLGGRRIIKKKKNNKTPNTTHPKNPQTPPLPTTTTPHPN